jgi:hypothetical protein
MELGTEINHEIVVILYSLLVFTIYIETFKFFLHDTSVDYWNTWTV